MTVSDDFRSGTLFDMPSTRDVQTPSIDREALRGIALLYTASEKGNNSGVRFAMSVDDACVWCSSEMSKGVLHGTHWAYFWTSALNFIECYWGTAIPVFDFSNETDNRLWDERIASLGLHKFSFDDMPAVFEPLGVKIILPKGKE